MTASVCHYGALSFNHATQQACVAGVALDLTPREAQVLDILLKRVGQIIPKERFLQDIAPDDMAMNTTAAEVYIHRLRFQFATSSAAATCCRAMWTLATVANAKLRSPNLW
jgi:DNA-binding response OmpR family regulator